MAQKKGKPSEILVPKVNTTEDGKTTLSLTAQTLADIFEEFPIVADAYAENVPPVRFILDFQWNLGILVAQRSFRLVVERGGVLGAIFQFQTV